MDLASLVRSYSGLPLRSLPHYQARARHLYYRFNSAVTGEAVSLLGKLCLDKLNHPYLGWDFEDWQRICLGFGEDVKWREFIHKDVRVVGAKRVMVGFSRGKIKKLGEYFEVVEIQEKEFDWIPELQSCPPLISNINDYLQYIKNSSPNELATKEFVLSLIGSNRQASSTGIGLSTYIPSGLHPAYFNPIIETYRQLDPFRFGGKPQINRFSDAFHNKPGIEKIILRETGHAEVDYVVASRKDTSNEITTKLVSGQAELYSLIGEGGIDDLKVDEDALNDLKYGEFYANRCIIPYFTKEAILELERVQVRIANMINRETSVDCRFTSEIIARTKIETVIHALAKANQVIEILPKHVKDAEELVAFGLINVMLDKDVSDTLLKMTVKMEKERTLTKTYKQVNSAHERIQIELRIRPQTKEELWAKMKEDYSKKFFNKVIEDLLNAGYIFEKKGKLTLAPFK